MNFDVNSLIVSFIFSAIGMVYFSYGKKQSNFWLMISGMILMGYSYFVDSITWNIVLGIALTIAPHLARL